jgi:type II secretory pathway pseudopilin PulG
MKKIRGFTLIEVLIAAAMAVLVLGALIRVFWFGRDVEREARSSYLIRQDADVAFRNIQEELRLTDLSSIRVGADNSGFSMATPIEGNNFKSFELTGFGVAKWKKWVHFTVLENGDNNYSTGALIRWESAYPADTSIPVPSTHEPTDITGDSKWVLLNDVVMPAHGVTTSSDGLKELGPDPNNAGLQLRFVRLENGEESLSTKNPAQSDDSSQADWSQGTTQLVDCRLQIGDISDESGKLSLYTINFRVKPRN